MNFVINSTAEGVINFKSNNHMLTWKMNVIGANHPTGVNIHKVKLGKMAKLHHHL